VISADREPPALHVDALSVAAGSISLVTAVSFTARPKEVVAVIGPNGAGKTTLLEAIVGLRQATAGRVAVDGRSLQSFRERASLFAYLPDQSELPPEVSVRTLVEHAQRLAPNTTAPNTLANHLGIAEVSHKPVGVLSRGEHKRLQLFCALLLRRPFLVADEPFSAFDPLQLRSVLAAVREITEAGVGVIASIHQLSDAERVADRILMLSRGSVVAFGTLGELREAVGEASASLEQVFVTLLSQRSRAT
jgi:ABC-2 type transport system ATP-binding protein